MEWFRKLFKRKEQLTLMGQGRLTAWYKGTNIIYKVLEGPNTIVTLGKTLIGDMLIDLDAAHDTGLTWLALGASSTAPVIGQTQLVNEGGGAAMRKAITSRSRLVNVVTFSTFFTAGQSTLALEEVGIFGTSTAGAAENSGDMFARWLSSFDNSAGNFDLTFDYVLSIGV